VKLLQEEIGNTMDHISIGNNFMSRTPIAQQFKDSIDKWDCMILKTSAQQRTVTIRQVRVRESSELIENIFFTLYFKMNIPFFL
jgi:hypothetical protein